jgi:hypothetical protein
LRVLMSVGGRIAVIPAGGESGRSIVMPSFARLVRTI